MPRKQSISESSPATAIASFETEFERLTAIVDRLEAGNVPLAEMLKLYEEGMSLSTGLKDVLSEAELKVEKLARVHEEKITEREIIEEDEADDSEEESDLLF